MLCFMEYNFVDLFNSHSLLALCQSVLLLNTLRVHLLYGKIKAFGIFRLRYRKVQSLSDVRSLAISDAIPCTRFLRCPDPFLLTPHTSLHTLYLCCV